jgi:hypothetical protein
MNIIDYVKSLLPSFGQDRILDDLARLRAEANDVLLPSLKQAEETFSGRAFTSAYAKGIEKTLKHRFDSHGSRATLFSILDEVYKGVPDQITMLDKLVESSFAKDVAQETVSYRKANILKYIETLNFSMQYTVRMLLRVIRVETGAAEDGESLHAAEKEHLDANYLQWLDTLELIDQKHEVIEHALSSIPEVGVADHVEGAIDGKKLDPLKMNFITPVWNPIYHVRLRMAEKTVADINRSKEERKLVELRLHDIKTRSGSKSDPVVQKQVELVEERLKKIDHSIARMSE